MTASTRYVGSKVRRPNAVPRLTGQEPYADDVKLNGMLHAHLVTSSHAAAAITSIDAGAALNVPGVKHVITAADLPEFARDDAPDDRMRFFLAHERVSYVGQPVAVVLADSDQAASAAADLVRIAYEPRPAVVHVSDALADDAPHVRPRRKETHPGQHPNLCGEITYQRGDVDRAFEDATYVVQRRFRTASVHQGYLEPRSVTASPEPTGKLTVWSATQGQFMLRSSLAASLGLAEEDLVIKPMTVGGGFGGRFMLMEPLVGLLAMLLHRSVKLTISRSQDFAGTTPAPEKLLDIGLAAGADGTITGLRADLLFNTGFFSKTPYQLGALSLGSNYRFPNMRIVSREVFTNRSGTGSYRAPGLPQMAFAIEQLVDELARKLEMNPIELRIRNVAGTGDPLADNEERWQPFDLKPLLREAEAHPLWTDPTGPNEGIGVAIGARRGATDAAQATAHLAGDGRLHIIIGSNDITGVVTSLTQIAADVLGVSLESIEVSTVSSAIAPYSGGSGGSKILYSVGNAVIEATTDVRDQILAIASEELEAGIDDLQIRDDRVEVRGAEEHFLTLADIYRLTIGYAKRHDPVVGTGDQANPVKASAVSVNVARVRVDPETGEVKIVGFLAVQDVGKAINPGEVEGQIIGGALQGVGIGLYEGLIFDDNGQLLSGTFMDYALPKASQAPGMEVRMIEDPAPHGPFGARGVAESPIIGPAAAIANAINDATGVRLTELPMTPERIWRGVREQPNQ